MGAREEGRISDDGDLTERPHEGTHLRGTDSPGERVHGEVPRGMDSGLLRSYLFFFLKQKENEPVVLIRID